MHLKEGRERRKKVREGREGGKEGRRGGGREGGKNYPLKAFIYDKYVYMYTWHGRHILSPRRHLTLCRSHKARPIRCGKGCPR